MSNYKDEMKYSSLAKILIEADYVIIDTCSLMENSFPEWLDILVETKEEYLDAPLPIYVLESSIRELERLSKDKKSVDRKIAAKQALRILKKSKRHKLLDFVNVGLSSTEGEVEESNDGEYAFADPKIVSLINMDRVSKRIIAITQDKKLASDILGLRNQQSTKGKPVRVYRIDENATLQVNLGEETAPSKPAKAQKKETKKVSEPKPAPAQSASKTTKKKDESAELLEKVLSADQRIHSIMSNNNYPKEKKIADLKAQLALLEKLGEDKLGGRKLKHDAASIKEDIKKLEEKDVPLLPQVEEKPKALPLKEIKAVPADKKANKKALWYEYGATLEEAFRNVGNHYGVVFRDPNVPYVPSVHGPVNFTSDDLAKIVASFGNTLKEGVKIVKQYKTVNLMAEKTPKGIKAWLDLERNLIVVPSAKAAQEVAKESGDTKLAKPTQAKASKAKKPATSEPKAEQPAKPKPQKQVQKAKAEPKAQPAQAVKEEAKAKKPTKLEQAVAADRRLKANIHNKNYSKAQKLKDVQEQIVLVKKIPLKDRAGLNFGLDSLKALLELLNQAE